MLEDYVRMPALLHAAGITNQQDGIQFTLQEDENITNVTIDPSTVEDALPVASPRRPLPIGWLDIRTVKKASIPVWQRNLDKFFWHKTLLDLDALYVQINRILENEPGDFAEFVADLPKPNTAGLSRLIIDLRTNRGGDATIVQPLVHYMIKHWQHLEPGTIFVLTSNYTFSAAAHLAAEIEKNTHAIFMGEATAAPPNHYADVNLIILPNSGIQVEVSSLYWQKSDPRDNRKAIYPDIEIPLTWYDFIQGQDSAIRTITKLKPESPELLRDQRPVFNWFRDTQKEK